MDKTALQSYHDNQVNKEAADGNATLLNKLNKQSLVDLAAHHQVAEQTISGGSRRSSPGG